MAQSQATIGIYIMLLKQQSPEQAAAKVVADLDSGELPYGLYRVVVEGMERMQSHKSAIENAFLAWQRRHGVQAPALMRSIPPLTPIAQESLNTRQQLRGIPLRAALYSADPKLAITEILHDLKQLQRFCVPRSSPMWPEGDPALDLLQDHFMAIHKMAASNALVVKVLNLKGFKIEGVFNSQRTLLDFLFALGQDVCSQAAKSEIDEWNHLLGAAIKNL